MNNNIVLNRIRRQMQKPLPIAKVETAIVAAQVTVVDNPLDIDELRSILMEELNVAKESPPLVVAEKKSDEIQFNNIYEFVPWYVENKTGFTPEQIKALDSVEEALGMIGKGCACRRAVRERIANQYFGEFWLQNQKTDLLKTIAKIANVSRVVMTNICSYPPSTP